MYSASSDGDCALVHTITPSPAPRAARSAPFATSTKNGFARSSTSRATMRLVPVRNWRADSLRT